MRRLAREHGYALTGWLLLLLIAAILVVMVVIASPSASALADCSGLTFQVRAANHTNLPYLDAVYGNQSHPSAPPFISGPPDSSVTWGWVGSSTQNAQYLSRLQVYPGNSGGYVMRYRTNSHTGTFHLQINVSTDVGSTCSKTFTVKVSR